MWNQSQKNYWRRLRNNVTKFGAPGNRTRLVDVSTPWKNLFETPKTEYDVALEELGENSSEKKYYW